MALETCDRQQQQQPQQLWAEPATRTRTKAKETENREQKEQLLKTEQESREEIFCCVAGDVFRAASCFSNACGAHGAAHLTNAKYVDLGTARHLRVLKITYIYTARVRVRGGGVEGKRGHSAEKALNKNNFHSMNRKIAHNCLAFHGVLWGFVADVAAAAAVDDVN